MKRRDFLTSAAAVPLVYGLRSVLVVRDDEEPAWLAQALTRMKETGRWGLIFILPDPNVRFKFGQHLWALTAFPMEDLEAHAIFCESVVTVMTPELARKKFAIPPSTTRILLSHEGKMLSSDGQSLDLERSKEFVASVKPFLHGAGNERLIARAAELLKALPAELKDALLKLGSESSEEQLAAKLTLTRHVERLPIALAHVAETSPVELARKRALNLLTGYFSSLKEEEPGSKLPFGAAGPHHYDPCPSCGMACLPPRSQKFLKFLVPEETQER